MKKYLFACLVLGFVACKKGDTGPQGPPGANGTNGTNGTNGNANVTQYNFGAQNLAAGFATLQVTTTADTMNRSQWYVYLYYQPITRWYYVPGFGYGGSTNYRVSMDHTSGRVNIYIDKTGTGENYAQARVIRVYANNVLSGGRSAAVPPVDVTDYKAMCRYYDLPE